MLLNVHNLQVCYGVISALQDVSLHIDRGEIVTLIGANGAGKTTLLRTISGLIRPTHGSIQWDIAARDDALAPDDAPVFDYASPCLVALNRLPPHRIVRLGISHIPEGRQIFANLTVRENLLLGAYQEKSAATI